MRREASVLCYSSLIMAILPKIRKERDNSAHKPPVSLLVVVIPASARYSGVSPMVWDIPDRYSPSFDKKVGIFLTGMWDLSLFYLGVANPSLSSGVYFRNVYVRFTLCG